MPAASKGNGPPRLFFPGRDAGVETTVTSVQTSSETQHPLLKLVPRGGPLFIGSGDEKLACVIFALPNFCDYVGRSISFPVERGFKRKKGRLIFEAEGWEVTLDAHEDTERLSKALENNGGHAITHVGRVARTNGEGFSAEEAEKLTAALTPFFSFARGISLAPILAVGFDSNGQRVWEDWGIRMVSRWEPGTESWFESQRIEQLQKLFPKFLALRQHSHWEKTISSFLYWYERSNKNTAAGGTDGSLVLSHAALDLIAWTYLVKDRQLVGRSKFRSRKTSENIRALLHELGAPTAIPEHLESLRQMALNEGWTDGPHALSKIRNNIVHPEREFAASGRIYFEAWTMAQWYVELVLLSLCNYEGTYANRTNYAR